MKDCEIEAGTLARSVSDSKTAKVESLELILNFSINFTKFKP